MKSIKKVAIIGHFGGNEYFSDGQTVKTLNLYKELSDYTNWKIIKVDTYYIKKKILKFFLMVFKVIFTTNKVIILLSGNGMKVFFPVLYFLTKLKDMEVYHDVIGGNLAQYVSVYPRYKKYLNSFRVNWVETDKLMVELQKSGITNIEVIPNFRRSYLISENELSTVYEKPYRFCTFSRVIKEKGIEEAINAVELLNSMEGEEKCCLDIYGPIDKDYRERFKIIMKNTTNMVSYCGEIPFDKAVCTLKDYYAVLFPTHWDGEGNAGTIIESFFAGVPVIASDWRCNKEMVHSKFNGMIYPSDYVDDLVSAIRWLIDNELQMPEIKRNCLESAKKYLPDQYIEKIVRKIQGQ